MKYKDNIIYQLVRKLYFGIKTAPFRIKKYIDTRSIKRFKNICKGETCFVIGNGPSMRVEDLDKIHYLNIKSFACNKIFLIFNETKWRPNYFLASDRKIISENSFENSGLETCELFFPRKYKGIVKKANYYELISHNWLEEGNFSLDAYKGIYQCETIIAEALQLAYYMGFSKVYIIGVDFSYNMASVNKEKQTFVSGGNNYFIKGYEKKGEELNLGNEKSNILGFEAALNAFNKTGREIYNATRGGKLEVFERRNLDEVFKEIEAMQ